MYVITKLGLLFVYDLESATAVYRTRISSDPIFLAAPAPATGGFAAINRCAQMLGAGGCALFSACSLGVKCTLAGLLRSKPSMDHPCKPRGTAVGLKTWGPVQCILEPLCTPSRPRVPLPCSAAAARC